jgi:hypothetical protein
VKIELFALASFSNLNLFAAARLSGSLIPSGGELGITWPGIKTEIERLSNAN